MKVVHVVRQFRPSVGGLEDFVFNLARQQCADRSTPSVLTLDRIFTDPDVVLGSTDIIADIPVTRIRWSGSPRYPIAPSVLKHFRDAELIHVHAVDFFFDFLAWTRAYHQLPMIATIHGGFFHTSFMRHAKRAYLHTVTRLSALAYDAIVACSGNDAALFAPIAASKITTIENGVDIGKFSGCSSARYTRRIVYFGRFAANKQIPVLFQLLRALHREACDWELLVAGSGDQRLDDLTRAATAARVRDHVRFFLCPSDQALRGILSNATYFACASVHEGFGIAAVEAMSAGLIPILSRIPPFIEIIRSAGTGLLFDPADPGSSAAALIELEQAAAPHIASVRQQLMQAAARYDWHSVAAKYAAHLPAPGGNLIQSARKLPWLPK
jgi:alpha-1,3-mannosyltransferase